VRVLVVDDDPEVLDVIEQVLGTLGFEVTGSGSADRARIRASVKHFDIALVDAPMRRLGGVSLAQELRECGTAVLMIPAGSDVVQPIEAAGLPYLMKPFTGAGLAATIRKIVGSD
jgi:DNA-binding response OmpR family regulator